MNFLSKGGQFRTPDDLSKIYGIRKEDFERLRPYVRLKEKQKEVVVWKNEVKDVQKEIKRYKPIDINQADTADFIALPGIGNKLAARIVNFRNKLGGFYAIDQIGETFGLADSIFQKIKSYLVLEDIVVKKFNINTATLDELKSHPYIRLDIAKSLIAYRKEHGEFLQLEDLKKVVTITEDIFKKLLPYLNK